MIIGTRNSLGNTVCVWIHMFRSDIDEINYHSLECLISTKADRYIRVEVYSPRISIVYMVTPVSGGLLLEAVDSPKLHATVELSLIFPSPSPPCCLVPTQ